MESEQPGDKPRRDPAHVEKASLGGREVRVEFIHHACDRMRQRGILVEDVLRCLRAPDNKTLDAPPGRKGWGRLEADGARMLKVVFEDETDSDGNRTIVVISAMWGKR